MRALVTGAAGFIGSNLAVKLAGGGATVVGLDDFSVGTFENLTDFTGDFVTADLAEPGWQARVGKVDAVFHQAAITDTTVTDQRRMMQVNVEAFRNILEWSGSVGSSVVVYASSAGVYGGGSVPMRESGPKAPLNIYAFSKSIMETVAAEASKRFPKMRIIGLRYFNVYGPRESHKDAASSMILQLSKQMRSGRKPRIFEFGDQFRDFIYVKDVVEANLLAAEKAPSGVYNVCTGQKATFNEVIKNLNEVHGLKLETEYFKNPYSFYQNETLGDPSKAEKTFGFKAKFSPEQGIKDYFRGKMIPAGV